MNNLPHPEPRYRDPKRRTARYRIVRLLLPEAATLLAQDHPDAPWPVAEEWHDWSWRLERALQAAFPEEWADRMARLKAELEPEARKEVQEEFSDKSLITAALAWANATTDER